MKSVSISLGFFANNKTRLFSTASKLKENLGEHARMQAWQVHSYGGLEELQKTTTRIPILEDPNEVLIKVEAASVNPIDNLMLSGYGRTLFQVPRNFGMELPLTLGRDFSGLIVQKGQKVEKKYNVGDRVYGFIPIHKQGTFSEMLVANESHINEQPPHLSAAESASLVYATMTAWSALYLFGGLKLKTRVKGTRILILGASGGVGTAAIQLLKSQGCTVFGSCSTDAMPLVHSLGADCVFDYKNPKYLENVANEGFYHIILDCAKFGHENIPRDWCFDTFITLNSPLLFNTDRSGLLYGLFESGLTFLKQNFGNGGPIIGSNAKKVRWGFFTPCEDGFKFIHNLVVQKKLNPQICKEFSFDQLPDAFKEVRDGHLRGKVVVKFNN